MLEKNEIIQSALHNLKIEELNPMQEASLEQATGRKDVILLSPTGSGKTLAYLLPLLLTLKPDNDNVQVLILVPSRELALQIDSVFKAMGLTVTIQIEKEEDSNVVNVDLKGDDMGVLIGKRGQTLDSLQYLVSLVVNKDSEDYIRVKVDTEDYRKRRKETLENLARGIAYKVRKTRKPVILEPMNPYERRIIHSALQGNKFVETVSEGEEPYRHVVVKLKRN